MEDNVNHPAHYTAGFANRPIECIDITRHLPFTFGNAVKYIWRAGKKGDRETALQDLDKADWYIEDWRRNHGNGTPTGLRTARAVFGLLMSPENDPLEQARYNVLDYLLRPELDMYNVDLAMQTMEGVIQHG